MKVQLNKNEKKKNIFPELISTSIASNSYESIKLWLRKTVKAFAHISIKCKESKAENTTKFLFYRT